MAKISSLSSSISCILIIAGFAYLFWYYKKNAKLPDILVTTLKLGSIGTTKDKLCPPEHYLFEGACYKNCPAGYKAKGDKCQISTCPENSDDMGDFCALKVLSREVVVNTACPDGYYLHEGKCYENCPAGFIADGEVCKHVCPVGFEDIGYGCKKQVNAGLNEKDPTCAFGEYLHEGKCYPNCKAGYVADGARCKQTCPENTVDAPLTCTKNSHGRGVGTIPTCAPGQYQSGALCYPNCKPGYKGVGPVCWQDPCPPDTTDIGVACTKATKGRGVGTVPTCAPGQYQSGGLCYPNCRNGYKGVGPVCWQDPCPSDTTDIGVACTKDTKGRGVGTIPTCGPGQYQSGGLCYPNCKPGYKGVGPVCWQDPCPPDTTDTGVSCTKNTYGRGAGTVPNYCSGGDMDTGLCYPNCNNGYKGVGPVCWGTCPGGYNDAGVSCAKPGSYGRGAGYSKS